MNKNGRKELERALGKLDEVRIMVEGVASEERDKYDNMPENLQGGEIGVSLEASADRLEEVDGDFDTLINALEEAME